MTSRLEPPGHYDPELRAIWADAVTRLTTGGRIFRADPEVLDAYVQAVRAHRQASRILAQSDVTELRDGRTIENPALTIQRRCAEEMARASKALGLHWTPTSATDPIAGAPLPSPIAPPADRRRWCDEHQRLECRHNRQDGTPCHQYRLVAGLDVCRKHGGKSIDKLRADGEQRQAETAAAKMLAQLDIAPVTDPLGELSRVAAQAIAWKDAMGGRVNQLTALRYESQTGGEQLRAEIALWERAMDRCVVTLTAIVKLNLEGRMAGVREATARMLDEALQLALVKSGATLAGQNAAREEFKKRLKVVA